MPGGAVAERIAKRTDTDDGAASSSQEHGYASGRDFHPQDSIELLVILLEVAQIVMPTTDDCNQLVLSPDQRGKPLACTVRDEVEDQALL
jgi:hypothetical protein